jgi:transposase
VQAAAPPAFVPAIIEAAPPPSQEPPPAPKRRRTRRSRTIGTAVELEIDGVAVKIAQGADAKVIVAVIDALIGPGSDARVLIATRPVDLRKDADSLAALVKAELGADPFSGVVYVFRAKKADRVKLVWWDGTGLCLMAKRLEQGGFRWPGIQDGVMRLTAAQLGVLLEGLDWPCPWWSTSAGAAASWLTGCVAPHSIALGLSGILCAGP